MRRAWRREPCVSRGEGSGVAPAAQPPVLSPPCLHVPWRKTEGRGPPSGPYWGLGITPSLLKRTWAEAAGPPASESAPRLGWRLLEGWRVGGRGQGAFLPCVQRRGAKFAEDPRRFTGLILAAALWVATVTVSLSPSQSHGNRLRRVNPSESAARWPQ